jgi:Zn-finger nucleic acid-binding protein
MKCPIDTDIDLVMTERSGIEIDYCPTCRGVWLDRGELDKIIERSAPAAPSAPPAAAAAPPMSAPPLHHAPATAPQPAPQRRWDDDWDDDTPKHGYDRSGKPYKKKRRGSFLEEIFDF